MTLGMFFNLISVQNIGAAYRHIQGGLGAAPDQVSWVVTSFLIAEVIMLPLSGWFLLSQFRDSQSDNPCPQTSFPTF